MGFWANFKYGNVGYKWKLKRSRSKNHMTAIKQSKIIKTFYRVFRTKKIQMSTEVLQVRCVCCVVSHFSHVWPCEHMVYSPAGSLVQGILRQEYWSVSPCPSPGDLPNPGIETVSLKSPALAGEFFTTRVTWTESESLSIVSDSVNPRTVVHGILQQNTGMGSLSLLQCIFPMQELNQDLSIAGGFFNQLNHQGVTWEAYLPSNLRNFSNSHLLTFGLGLGLALHFFYSVTRGGCFIWKLFLGEGKGNFVSIDVPIKGKRTCFHLF